MAVEAHHLHLFPRLLMDRELGKDTAFQPAMLGTEQTDPLMTLAAGGMLSAPFCGSSAAAAPSASGLTIAGSSGILGKKRGREQLSFLGENLTFLFQQQMLDLDRLLAHHTERMRSELAERRKRFSRQLAAAMEDGARKLMKAKDEEIERVRKVNWALEERIRSLCVENQIWRELAHTNEATANLLRNNLEQLLTSQLRIREQQQQQQQRCDDAAPAADDAESCFCGENEDHETAARVCRSCRLREPTVLLLPCRHLCLCAACGPATNSCPICHCSKNGSVNLHWRAEFIRHVGSGT